MFSNHWKEMAHKTHLFRNQIILVVLYVIDSLIRISTKSDIWELIPVLQIHATWIRFKRTPTPKKVFTFKPLWISFKCSWISFPLRHLLIWKITGMEGWGALLWNGTYYRMTAFHKGERWPDEKDKPMTSLQNKIPGKPRSHQAPTTAALRHGDKGIKRPVKQPPF